MPNNVGLGQGARKVLCAHILCGSGTAAQGL